MEEQHYHVPFELLLPCLNCLKPFQKKNHLKYEALHKYVLTHFLSFPLFSGARNPNPILTSNPCFISRRKQLFPVVHNIPKFNSPKCNYQPTISFFLPLSPVCWQAGRQAPSLAFTSWLSNIFPSLYALRVLCDLQNPLWPMIWLLLTTVSTVMASLHHSQSGHTSAWWTHCSFSMTLSLVVHLLGWSHSS